MAILLDLEIDPNNSAGRPPEWIEALARDIVTALTPVLGRLPAETRLSVLLEIPQDEGLERINLGNMCFDCIIRVVEEMRQTQAARGALN